MDHLYFFPVLPKLDEQGLYRIFDHESIVRKFQTIIEKGTVAGQVSF